MIGFLFMKLNIVKIMRIQIGDHLKLQWLDLMVDMQINKLRLNVGITKQMENINL